MLRISAVVCRNLVHWRCAAVMAVLPRSFGAGGSAAILCGVRDIEAERAKEDQCNLSEIMVKRLATLVGCNYTNTPNQLNGCINDVEAVQAVLIDRFGFQSTGIKLLTDAPNSSIKPTGENIKRELRNMINVAKQGDLLFFYFSGHGTLISSTDDAIVPCDFNLITDVDFRVLVNRLPEGAIFTIFSDSCHSGGLIDKEKEQIGPHSSDRELRPENVPNARQKLIPISSIINSLRSISGRSSDEPVSAHLTAAFGNEASAKYLPQSFQSHELKPLGPDNGILLSGCQKDEVSLDIPRCDGSKAYGAFTYDVLQVLKVHRGPISNRDLVIRVREKLREKRHKQHPCLYCSDKNAKLPLLLETARSSE
ncbi:metacaspase-9-like [Magnolia sinica]|uniref:metacaspase-9-like n=1 Tax=Magnolia sinica TaxID=86752 RepID=UPI00265A36A9|nr:metacaspase-9-like [Magnolia sinica]